MLLLTRITRSLFILATLFALAACGGGGTGTPFDNNTGGDTGTGAGGTGDPVTPSASIDIVLQDPDNPGTEVTTISSTDAGQLVVTLTDASGDPLAGLISLETTTGQLEQTSALTNSTTGQTTINLTVGTSGLSAGRVTVTYSPEDGTDDVVGTLDFAIVTAGTSSGTGFTMSLALASQSDGATTTSVSSVEPGLLTVTLTDSNGVPIVGSLVDLETSIGAFTDSELDAATVLTDTAGQASIKVVAGDSAVGTAGTITATLASLSVSANFSIGAANLDIGSDTDGNYADGSITSFVSGDLDITVTSLSSSGSTTIRVIVVDGNGDIYVSPVTVNFEANCSPDTYELDTGVTTVNGVATSTFTADGCTGSVTLTASIEEIGGVTATGAITIAAASPNTIEFVSTIPESISFRNTGTDQAEITFRVLNDSGNPASSELVSFELSTDVGGIALQNTSALSQSDGEVVARVTAGSVPTPVQVIASIDLGGGNIVSTVSNVLTISTGLPDQDSFSLSASVLNPGGDSFNGVTTQVTIRAADAFNNPVPDGTAINFVAEYGAIEPDCTTVNGACSVTWTSQNPRTQLNSDVGTEGLTGKIQTISDVDCDINGDFIGDNGTTGVPCLDPLYYLDTNDLDDDGSTADYIVGQIYGGRTTILAYAVGEESFIDSNSNGRYDVGEVFGDLPEPHLDENEDGVYGNASGGCASDDGSDECAGWEVGGAEEIFFDITNDGVYDGDVDGDTGNGSVGDGLFNGSSCSDAALAASACTRDSVYVRDSVTILMSGATPYIGLYNDTGTYRGTTSLDVSGGPETIYAYVSDRYNGYLQSGTIISIENDNCKLNTDNEYTVPNTSAFGFSVIPISLSEDTAVNDTFGVVTITATTPEEPNEIVSQVTFSCIDAD